VEQKINKNLVRGAKMTNMMYAYKYKSELNDWLVDEHFGRY
jgi:hypothetical protein